MIKDIVSSSPDVLGGTVVFKDTRVPVKTLFDHLEAGIPLDEFLEGFPSVTREQAEQLLKDVSSILESGQYSNLNETAT